MDGRADMSWRDPVLSSTVLRRVVNKNGWSRPLAAIRLREEWGSIVGAAIAEHTTIESYDDETRTLSIRCDSTPWATQLTFLREKILETIEEKVGEDTVSILEVLPPSLGPQRRYARRVKGRGPRDDFG